MTEKTNNQYLSLQCVKNFINSTLVDSAYSKYRQNRLVQYLKQRQSPQGANYTEFLLQKIVQNQLLQPTIRTTQIQEQCPNVNIDQMKAKMMKSQQLRNSSINFRNYQIDSIQRTHRYKDTIIQCQLDDSEINKKGLRGTTNRSSYFSDHSLKDQKKKIYRHQKTLTSINPNRKKYNSQSKNLISLIEYQHGIKHQSLDQATVKKNKQIQKQIQSLRNKKIKLQAAFSSFNQSKFRTFFGQQTNQKSTDQKKEKQPNIDSFFKSKKDKDSQPQFKCIITDYDGQIIPPLVTQKLKKVNAKNKQNIIKNNLMPIVRVKTEVSSNYFGLQQNQKQFKPSRKYIKHKDTLCKPFSTAKESKNSQKAIDQKLKVSVYNTSDDWTKLDISLKKKPEQYKRDNVKVIFDIDQLSKSRRMIQKINKSQKKLV